jgi:hypothetical protein
MRIESFAGPFIYFLCQTLLIIGKVYDAIEWPWYIILLPIWGPIAVFVYFWAGFAIAELWDNRRIKKDFMEKFHEAGLDEHFEIDKIVVNPKVDESGFASTVKKIALAHVRSILAEEGQILYVTATNVVSYLETPTHVEVAVSIDTGTERLWRCNVEIDNKSLRVIHTETYEERY